jgi:YfiH family protein
MAHEPEPTPVLLHATELFAMDLPHAFTTRHAGFSRGPFDSLNFGNPSHLAPDQRDPAERIARNWALVQQSIGCATRERVEVHQVHGAGVLIVRAGSPAHGTLPPGVSTKADAIVTDDPARVLAVRVADCAPVLLASGDGRCVAAIHAGWKGVLAGVIEASVRAMRALGHEPVVAAIGPCIGPAAFEVGPDVADPFRARFGDAIIARTGKGDRSMLDLRSAITILLREAGVGVIDSIDLCTHARSDLFFSHRRESGSGGARGDGGGEAGRTGRMAALIAPITHP